MNIENQYLGKLEFNEAFELQTKLWQKAKDSHVQSIIGLEHPAVISLGRRADSSEIFNQNQIPVAQATRGGLATIHSEGQLVIYPIMELSRLNLGVRDFVSLLLRTTQMCFQNLGVVTYLDDENIGLYTQHGKIAFCGLQIKNRISLHGISINISNDLELFQNIRSCGFAKLDLDRLENYRTDVSLLQFYKMWIEVFLGQMNTEKN
jgi:lipoyl(octanoyl) transferase